MSEASVTALRGTIVGFTGDPFLLDRAQALTHEPDGLILCRDGLIEAVGPHDRLKASLPAGVPVTDYSGCILSAGFVDTHVHYVQTEMIASPGKQLLEWVNDYIYPAEEAFADEAHASVVASVFCDQLLRNGTTTRGELLCRASAFRRCIFRGGLETRHAHDRGEMHHGSQCTRSLRDTAQRGYDESKALIERWDGKGRASICHHTQVCAHYHTPAQMELAGALWREHPGTYLQSHIAENRARSRMGKEDISRANRAIWISTITTAQSGPPSRLWSRRLADRASSPRCTRAAPRLRTAPRPTSFSAAACSTCETRSARERPVHVGLATDVGAGTTLSMLQTVNEAYKIAALNAAPIDTVEVLYLATLGGATSLGLEDCIGSLQPGREADIVVLDPKATPLLAFREARSPARWRRPCSC